MFVPFLFIHIVSLWFYVILHDIIPFTSTPYLLFLSIVSLAFPAIVHLRLTHTVPLSFILLYFASSL